MSRVRKKPYSGLKKIILLLFVLGSVFVLIFAAAKGKYQFPLSERIVVTVVAPFEKAVNSVGNQIRTAMESVWEIATVYEQNKMLQSEVEQLRVLNIQMNEISAENDRLRVLLDYKQQAKQFDLLVAAVIARDPGTWTSTMLIDKGRDDGLDKNMVVVTAQGLVGNVVEVFASTARVQLILDPRSAVGAIVQRSESRVAGIVEGDKGSKTMARMVNIPRDADIVEGDRILSSGFGGIYPKGIPIGVVEKIVNDEGGLLKSALLKPDVDFQKLEEVSVVVKSRETPPQALHPTDDKQKAADGIISGGMK